MYEVEVKVEAAHGPVRERLAELGAEALGAVHQRDTYYDHPTRSFGEADEALRLRRTSGLDEGGRDGGTGSGDDETARGVAATTATLAYKGPLVDDVSKTREEVETDLDDPDAADAILRAVGFEPAAEVEKRRELYAFDGYTVALDAVRGLGEFVEVEAGGREPDVEALRDGAFEVCRRLGLDPDDATRTSYLAMLLGDG